MHLSKHHNLTRSTRITGKWFEKTEVKRLRDPEYYFLMTRAANSRSSIEGRFKWILSEFVRRFERFKVVDLDARITFDDEQREEIFRRDKGKCQGTFCGGKAVNTDKWHADHIFPWIQGGLTEVENGQVLCSTCNLKKTARFW